MLNMEILSIFLAAFSLAVAQYPPRNPGFRNQGFRNVRTPLATSATKDRPFISIPIVLLPDGQPVPKPKHSTYHYVGHALQNAPGQQNQRNLKQRSPMMSKSVANYQVAIPPQVSQQSKKITKPPKLTTTQLNSQLRTPPSNFQRGRGQGQNLQQNQSPKSFQQNSEQNQQIQVQFLKQQRNPTYQQQSTASSQQASAAHKQNVENFVNFAANLGATVISQHQNQQVILPTQTPAVGLSFQNSQNFRVPESYLNQRSLLSNHKLNNGVTFQHQVPSPPNTQVQYTQVVQNNVANQNNGYTPQQQQHTQLPSTQMHQQQSSHSQQHQQQSSHSQQHQQQLRNSHSYQQQLRNTQVNQQQLTNPQGHQQQLTNLQVHQQQITNPQVHQQQLTNSQQHQQQLTNSQSQQLSNPQSQQLSNSQSQQLSNSQSQQLSNSQSQRLSNSQPQQELPNSQPLQHSTQNPSSIGSYLSAASVQPSTSQPQVTELSNGVSTQGNEANLFQQNGASYRTQTNSNDVVLLNNYNSQLQQGNQQSYAIASPQQQTVASQVSNNYDAQPEISKTVLSAEQPETTSNIQNTQNAAHTSYLNQNQEDQENYNLNSQGQQITFPSNIRTASGFPLDQIAEINTFSLQNAHSNNGQNSNPVYFHYQTGQDLPLSYSTLFSQGQAGYLSSQSGSQSDSVNSNVDQSYSILPNNQNVFANNGQSVYTSPQDDSSSSDSSTETGAQNYDSYSNDQSVYSPTSGQTNQGGYINTPNVGKTYQSSQYNYLLQNSPESQSSQSTDNQNSPSSAAISSGPLIYASSSPKQISYSPSASSVASDSQQYSSGNYQQSPTYISFTTSNANLKSEQVSALNYGQRSAGVITPGSTYAKSDEKNGKQSDAPQQASESSEDTEYDEDEDSEEEEASYKVVYIPLDILKNILSNSVENQ